MGLELIVLGAGSILPRAGYGCSGYAVRVDGSSELTLLDCGPGSVRALGTHGLELKDVRRVVLSHFHPDHCLDLFALFFARRNPGLAHRAALEVVGPVGLVDFVAGGAGPFGRWVEPVDTELVEVSIDDAGRGRYVTERFTLTCVRTGHTPHALAWRAEGAGISVAYSGDTGEVPAVAELANDVGLFVLECSFSDDAAVPHHLTPSSAARLAQASGCRRLLLTHFYPGLDPDEARRRASTIYAGPIESAHDGFVRDLDG